MSCYARQLLFAVIAVLALGHLIAACGQKGPLYLPDAGDTPAEQTDAGTQD
jgi:predicted small lipoprotein YifL